MGTTPTAATPAAPTAGELYTRLPDGAYRLHFHAGQRRAFGRRERFIGVLAGTQGGKTVWAPWWLYREIYDESIGRGAGDYLAVTASYDLFKLKMLPAIREVFEHVTRAGRYWGSGRLIELADPSGRFRARRVDDPMWGRVILRSAEAAGGLEASTAKGAWLDEAGLDSFTDEAWRAVLRRLSIARGRCLVTTTLYNFGWVKTEVYDRWRAGDPDYAVVHFDSVDNPQFSRDEWERARGSMPPWRFAMQYRGMFERPAGMIYDCFLDAPYPDGHRVKRFAVPDHWPRLVGMDFGGANTAAVFFAWDPQVGVAYAYREYRTGGRTAAQHAVALRAGEPPNLVCVGGSKSEGQWRDEFAAAGLYVYPPDISEVELGITRVYGAIRSGRVLFFDDLARTLCQLRSYSRKLDAAGQPTDRIDDKASYHELDAARYVLGWLFRPERSGGELVVVYAGSGGRWGA